MFMPWLQSFINLIKIRFMYMLRWHDSFHTSKVDAESFRHLFLSYLAMKLSQSAEQNVFTAIFNFHSIVLCSQINKRIEFSLWKLLCWVLRWLFRCRGRDPPYPQHRISSSEEQERIPRTFIYFVTQWASHIIHESSNVQNYAEHQEKRFIVWYLI